jgi:hypothetical protein
MPAFSLVGEEAVCLPDLAIVSSAHSLLPITARVIISDPAGLSRRVENVGCAFIEESQITPTGANQFPMLGAPESVPGAPENVFRRRVPAWVRVVTRDSGALLTAYVRA